MESNNPKISHTKRLRLRDKHSNMTYKEVLRALRDSEKGKCMVIRPTGFGKSYMLAKITSENQLIQNGGNALYVYPYETIKEDVISKYGRDGTSDVRLVNTKFMTYKTFVNYGKNVQGKGRTTSTNKLRKYLDENNIKMILLDEVHMAGSLGFREAYKNIESLIGPGKIRLVGVTATSMRMDGYDVLSEIFDNNSVYKYTMDDCIKDGLMLKPIYRNSIKEEELISEVVKEYINKYEKLDTDLLYRKAKQLIKEQDKIEIGDLLNTSNCIRHSIQKSLDTKKPSYLKFIVFCPTIKSMDELHRDTVKKFTDAFNYLRPRITKISSASDSDDVTVLHGLKHEDGIMDIIFCVNKINMGYHVDDINGIMMLRGTRSDIIYRQQIGRCMSITSEIRPVIFDMINNLSKKPYFLINKEELMENEESDSETGIKNIETVDEVNTINENSVDTDEAFREYDLIVAELVDELHSMLYKEINWVYGDRVAPVYIVQDIYNSKGTKKNTVNILESLGIQIEDEGHLKELVSTDVKRKLVASK